MFKYIAILLLLLLGITTCNNHQEKDQDLSKLLYLAEISHNFNVYQEWFADENIHEFYLEDTLRGKDQLNDLKFHYGRILILKKDTIDSLHKLLAGTFWLDQQRKPIDTMTYVNSTSVVEANAIPSERLKNQIIGYIDVLSKIHLSLVEIKEEVEKQRSGTKKETIICQNCTLSNSSETIKNTKNMAELYFETENQFTIIYRQLRCTAYAVMKLNVDKMANRFLKVRI